ncbi:MULTISPECIES: DUF4184 family protein [unclassified Rathayibacter]|uniref:DUF4184 family protein n=1 Tax=unclassified Rathayibacter TaxID=2609250 RepID=UPI00188B8735|nr:MULTISPECIES: DUF4184 family protein [unclassified Rathayibacter]MBF4463057.1 DUF4184 family protein [Rathayibacter sp. VKM Ac-2879]MBF4504706.1 DUF4184 family protein [Rathayibacter sp. VKM Ac-2878]
MPFMPSHAVVALAFRNGRIPASAVALGAVVPDAVAVSLGAVASLTHSLLGIVTIDLLLGLGGFLLWRALVAPAWRDFAPAFVRARLRPAPTPPSGWRAVTVTTLRASVGVMIGAATHVLWDGFTYSRGPFVAAIPFLRREVGSLPGYLWLQYGSALVGLLGLGIAALVWYVSRRPRPVTADRRGRMRVAAWTTILLAMVVPAGVILAGSEPEHLDTAYHPHLVAAAGVAVESTAGAIVAVAVLWRLSGMPSAEQEAPSASRGSRPAPPEE